jgi:hypothetical protein
LPKKNNNQPQREMTKRQLSHWQRENKRQRVIMLSGIILIVAILAVVGTGLFMNKYKPYHVTVLKVGNTEYRMDYYIDMLAYYGLQYGSPQMIQYFAEGAADNIAQNQIYVEEAAKLGITVSDTEIQKYLKDNKLSSSPTRVDSARAILTVQKMQTDYFIKQVPSAADQRHVEAMFLASQSQVDAVKARLDKGENFLEISAELSLEKTSKDNKGDFGWVPKGVLSSILNKGNSNTAIADHTLDDQVFAANTSVQGLNSIEDKGQMKQIGYWLVKVTETKTVNAPTPTATATPSATPAPTTIVQDHVYAMLLANEQQANDIKAKLEQGGEGNDWATLAKANSLDSNVSTDSGDKGFVSKGTLGEAIDTVLFPADTGKELAPNTISSPIPDTTQSTAGGFWLVKVTGIETQNISDDNKTILAHNMLSDWLTKVWTDNKGQEQNLLTDSQKQFAIQEAQKR